MPALPAKTDSHVWISPSFSLGKDPFEQVGLIDGEVFRNLSGRRTLRFERDGKHYFLKHHTGVGWLEIVKNLFQLRAPIISAENEWLAIERLEQADVPTMTVAAYGRRGRNPARIESFVITEALEPTVSLEDYTQDWAASPPCPSHKRNVISKVAQMARAMHRSGLNHRDFYLCHFLLHTDLLVSGRIKLSLIDLHRAQLRENVPIRWRNKDLASLYFSAIHIGLTERDYLRFLRIYFDVPLRQALKCEASSLRWIHNEGLFLRKKYLRKYAPKSTAK